MKTHAILCALAVGAALSAGVPAPGAAQAQSGGGFETSGGFGGSFDTGGSAAATPSATPPPTAQGGGFGGSFGGSFEAGGPGAPTPAPTPDPTPGREVPVVGGDSFGPGSFDAVVIEPGPVAPAPPAPVPAPPPAPSPPPGPPVDPQLIAFEARDYGIPPSQNLRQGNFHGPTPTSLPGAQVVATQALAGALQSGQSIILIDVLGSDYSLPDAYLAPALASGGSFNDRTQQQAVQWLRQITGGNSGAVIVLYCSDPMCWLSYNAALRTVAAGYTNVYWYRGGLRAWQMAGLQLYPTGF
ncbi:rhodanese-like domain-containing protein [Roseivivax sp. CAU 1753]